MIDGEMIKTAQKMIKGIEKAAAVTSEYVGHMNPLNVITAPFGMAAGALIPTKTGLELQEQARSGASNLLPGVGCGEGSHKERL